VVDRCADVTALSDFAPVSGTTVGSTLLNDWYDENGCNAYLPGYERVYSVVVPAGATLRARALGPTADFAVMLATDCGDVVNTCASGRDVTHVRWTNHGEQPFTMFVIVDSKPADAQGAFTLYLSVDEPACGDHLLDWEEQCDDGDDVGEDGCSGSCQIESGYVCPQANQPCRQIVCGDGIVDGPTQGGGGGPKSLLKGDEVIIISAGEHCDDHNTDDEDGCSSTCQIETGYACSGAPSVCVLRPQGDVCSDPLPLAAGDYQLAGFNDDYFMGQGPDVLFSSTLPIGQLLRIKGTASFDGYATLSRSQYCPQNIAVQRRISANVPFDLTFERTQVEEIGGNDVIVWFSADMPAVTQPFTISSVTLTLPVCGDGAVSQALDETCDDGNQASNDGCDANCHIEPGYACSPGLPCHHVMCGDGITDWPFEDCEDGNTVSSDGCSSICRTESGYLCDWQQMLCEVREAGDLCNNADAIDTPFFQNELSMAGMTPDQLDCAGCDATRWFSFVQQPGDVTVVDVDGTFNGSVNLYGTACPIDDDGKSQPLSNMGFGSEQDAQLELFNDAPVARTLWMRVTRFAGGGGGGGDTFVLRMKTGPFGCGDGILNRYGDSYGSNQPQARETCDDMNETANDGCSSSCQVEPGFRCPYYGGPCVPIVCGDGVVDQAASSSYEACDDGNEIDGDGCTSCQPDPGASCDGSPSTCSPTAPGDMCETALPLPLGDSNHTIDPFTADPYDLYHDAWSGQSAWYATTLAPREVVGVSATASFTGYVQLQSSGATGCANRIGHDFSSFGSQTQFLTNQSQQPMTVYVVVYSDNSVGATGSFTLTATKSIPTEDCSSGECVSVICGDGMLQGSEQCDDGDNVSGDGCSASCVAETATHVCTGDPSTCALLQPGDACDNALPLVDGDYDFSGYLPEGDCTAVCGGASRWFTITVPAWHSLWYHLSTHDDALYGMVRPFDVSTSCWEGQWHGSPIGTDSFYFDQDAKHPWVNASPIPIKVAIAVWSEQSSTSASFTLEHSLNPIGCGDGLIDYNAQYGAYEGCDDGNDASGDGCDASCQPEPGWDCNSGTCVAVVCGDGVINGDEGCDDFNADPDDGCSDTCSVEPGWLCGGEPYACYRVANGDMCSNAQPFVDGNYDLAGFLPDLPCADVCQGPDRWLTIDVPAGQTLLAEVSSQQQGSMRYYDITQDGCSNLSGSGSGGYFGGNQNGEVVFVNWSAVSPRTIAVAVSDPYNTPSSFAFSVSHQLKPIGCGDGYVDFGDGYGPQEQCDDGNQNDDDGCSSTCTIDPSWVCGNGSPSRCVLPPPGDMCQTAQPLLSGDYDLDGYVSECVGYCMPDRWFVTDLAAGDLLVMNMTTTSSYAHARLYDLSSSTCSSPEMLTNFYFFANNPPTQMVWYAPSAMKVALELGDIASDPSTAQFTLDVRQGLPHCGDSFADTSGQFGAPEQCDDGNAFDNDSCNTACLAP
jgi:cysteine-rich repeat protein